jgi:hypothetical protein
MFQSRIAIVGSASGQAKGEGGLGAAAFLDDPHLDHRDISNLELLKRKEPLKPLVANRPGLQFTGRETGRQTDPETRR